MSSESSLGDLSSLVAKKQKIMGRGTKAESETPEPTPRSLEGQILTVPWSDLYSEAQVRKRFENIDELAASIEANGLDEPIKVHPKDKKGYKIRRGERRWRACKQLDHNVDIIIVEPQEESREVIMQITENLQRTDLTPVELGDAYQRLIEEFGLNQKEIAEALGKSKSHVSKYVALTNLPPRLIPLVEDQRIVDHETVTGLKRLHETNKNAFDTFCYQVEQGEDLPRQQVLKSLAEEKADNKGGSRRQSKAPSDKNKEEKEIAGFRLRNPSNAKLRCTVDVDGDKREALIRLDLACDVQEKVVVELTDSEEENAIEAVPAEVINIIGIE